MRRMTKIIAAIALCFAALTSCRHKELCLHHPHTANVRIDVDWSGFEKEVPTGMTVLVYDDNGDLVESHLTNTTTHAYVSLEAGTYHSIVYNQSTSEFGSVKFNGMDNYATAEVCTRPVVSKWYKTKAEEERVGADPEWIGADRVENSVVTPEMVDETTEHFVLESKTRAGREMSYVIAEHHPLNIIYTVYVTIHVDGIYNLRSARASLEGLAEGYVFHKEGPTASIVTQLLESWDMTQDKTDPTKGYVTSKITCFGLPDGHKGLPEENPFVFSALLVDNATIAQFPFEVGDKFRKRVVDGVEQEMEYEIELWLSVPLPDVPPAGGSSSGFDAIVEEWGDEIEQNIQM